LTVCEVDDLQCLLHGNNGGWLSDPRPEDLYTPVCDVERVDLAERNLSLAEFMDTYSEQRPVLLRGLQDGWAARANWQRSRFRARFGQFPTQVSLGPTIVFGGGGRSSSRDLGAGLDSMERHMRSAAATDAPLEDFTFDSEFLEAMPGIQRDYRTPEFFAAGFNSAQSMRQKSSWHILSLGPTRGGLPSHVHGQTWLALVYGLKRWFLWPPGRGVDPGTWRRAGYHHLEGSWRWFQKVYPLLREEGEEGGAAAHERPLECVQRPGEVLYLPRNWKHLTLNVGEALGVGGQAGYSAAQRLEDNLAALDMRPDELEALLGAGLSHAHLWLQHEDDAHLDRCLEFLERAIALVPTQPEAWLVKGEVLLAAGRREAAGAHIDAGLAAFSRGAVPADVPTAAVAGTQQKLAQLYLAFEDGHGAEPALRGVLALLPDSAQAWHDLALALCHQRDDGRLAEAREAVGRARELSPHDKGIRQTERHVEWRLAQRDKANNEAVAGQTEQEEQQQEL